MTVISIDELKTDYNNPIEQCRSLNSLKWILVLAKAPKLDVAHNPSTKPKSSPKLPDGVNGEGRCRFQRFFTSRHIDNFKTNGAASSYYVFNEREESIDLVDNVAILPSVGDNKTALSDLGNNRAGKGRVLDQLVVGLKPGGNMSKASSWREVPSFINQYSNGTSKMGTTSYFDRFTLSICCLG
uniref:TLDc domain-containing protein n=1 Tax=Rhabditophanes sp. KR3021 TaxID=114890 RepID=A0AC35UH14_9BILA